MEIIPGVRRCSFGYGEVSLTQAEIDRLNTDAALVALGTRIDDIQSDCTAVLSHYQCKCGLMDLLEAGRKARKKSK